MVIRKNMLKSVDKIQKWGGVIMSALLVFGFGLNADVTAVWTGGGDRANVNDPANWKITGGENTYPDANTDIVISGETDFNCPEGETLAYKSLTFGDIKLTKDCDWRGLALASDSFEVPEAKGTECSYIDTRFAPDSNTRIVMDITVKGVREHWFGVWNIAYNDGAFCAGNDNNGIYTGFGNQGKTSGKPILNGRHTIDFANGVLKVDGVVTNTLAANEFKKLDGSLYLFAQNRINKGHAWAYYHPQKNLHQNAFTFHSCQIYDGETLVRDFIPAFDGRELGVYDKCEKKFYPRKGETGKPFEGKIVGPEINGVIDLNGHNLTLATTCGSGTITDTTSYIDAPRGAYIDTGYKPNHNTRVVMDATLTGKLQTLFGVSDDGTNHFYHRDAFGVANDGSKFYCGYGDNYSGTNSFVGLGRHMIEYHKGIVTVDGVLWAKVEGVDAVEFQLNNTMYFFAHNMGGTAINTKSDGPPRIHSLKIYEGDVLIKNFVPAYNGSEYGFYEKIEGKFVEGSGEGDLCGNISDGRLVVSPPKGCITDNTTLTISGALKLVKEGEGMFIAAKENQSYTGGTEVRGGMAKFGALVGAFGGERSDIVVESGATVDFANKSSRYGSAYNFYIAGNGVDGLGALFKSVWGHDGAHFLQKTIASLTLLADAKINGCPIITFIPNSTIRLNGYTLTVDLMGIAKNTQQFLSFRGVTAVDTGTIVFNNTTPEISTFMSFYENSTYMPGVTLRLGKTAGMNVEKSFTIASFIDEREKVNYVQEFQPVIVLDTYKPLTTNRCENIMMGDATHLSPILDLSEIDAPFMLDADTRTWSKEDVSIDSKLAVAEGATIQLKIGSRRMGGKPVMSWKAGNKPAWVDSLKFACGDANRTYNVEVREDGIYASMGFVIILK